MCMQKYSLSSFTYGAELEYGDVKYGCDLPKGNKWNTKDFTVVNSDGTANDPKGLLCNKGGEINTAATQTIKQQVDNFVEVLTTLRQHEGYPVTVNYRSNLHIHVGVPGLNEDLDACKRLFKYFRDNVKDVYPVIEPIPEPKKDEYESEEAYKGALKRYRRRKRSHQFILPPSRADKILTATSTEEFFNEHAPVSNVTGRRLWSFTVREGVNFRQLWEDTETLEFRHFPGTVDKDEFETCLHYCALVTAEGLKQTPELTPLQIVEKHKLINFPKFEKYNHELEKIFAQTNLSDNTRKQVTQYYENNQ